jgi:hypothetical protein
MHWKSLVLASEIFGQQEWNRFYFDYMGSRDEAAWYSDAGPSDVEIVELFRFLNQLASHHPSGADARARFKRAYHLQVLPRLRALQGLTLLDATFGGEVVQGMCVSKAVDKIFGSIAEAPAGSRYASTATSKILHVLNPSLFVMWDSAIRGGYAVDVSSGDYARRFLPRMQRQASEAVDSYIRDGEAEPAAAVEALEKRCGGRPLTKLVDEYNYCKFTLRADELWG